MSPIIPLLRAMADSLEEYEQQQEILAKEHIERLRHPGMVKFKNMSEFWEEVDKANEDAEKEKIRRLVYQYVNAALSGR
jgi:hypothetical protein